MSNTIWSGAKQTTVYLHSSSKSNLEISEGDKKHTLEPGDIVTIAKNNVTMSCSGDYCDSSIWHTVTIPEHQYHVNDANGAVFKVSNKIFLDDYTCFFDFGEKTRIFTSLMNFSRVGTVFDITYYDEDSNKIVTSSFTKLDEVVLKINSPSFIHINRAKYSNVSFRIVAGSSRRMDNEFDGKVTSGRIKVFNQEIEEPFNEDLLNSIPIISKISHVWINLQYFFLLLSLIIMAATIISVLYMVYIYLQNRKDNSQSDDDAKGEEIELGNL